MVFKKIAFKKKVIKTTMSWTGVTQWVEHR